MPMMLSSWVSFSLLVQLLVPGANGFYKPNGPLVPFFKATTWQTRSSLSLNVTPTMTKHCGHAAGGPVVTVGTVHIATAQAHPKPTGRGANGSGEERSDSLQVAGLQIIQQAKAHLDNLKT
jgi:hypothetical protein